MSVAEIDICNLALSHLAVGLSIASLTERSKEAQACALFYEPTRDKVLEDFPWPFAKRFLALSVVEDDPNDEWGFSYRLPADCHVPRRILSGQRVDTVTSRVPYDLAGDDTGPLLYTDREDAVLEYSALITDTTRFTPSFVDALAFALAARIGPRVAGDKVKLIVIAEQQYRSALADAQRNAFNALQPDPAPESSFIDARN